MGARTGRSMALATVVVALIGVLAVPAGAAHAGLTLESSASKVRFGGTVTLSGLLTVTAEGQSPGGQVVRILDAEAVEWGTAVTAEDGSFSLQLAPPRNLSLRAEWTDEALPETVSSEPVGVFVRPIVSVGLGKVFLFAKVRVSGRLRPAHPDSTITVRLLRGSTVVARRDVALDDEGRYATRFWVGRPGRYQARARFSDDDHLPVVARTGRKAPPLPSLSVGSRGITVRLLERRLRRLHYRVPSPDQSFDYRTADAVLAFNKVQGRTRVSYVTESTWRALVDPRRPRARSRTNGFHIEVDKTRQVLYTVKGGKITNIVHVSTGAYPGWTRDGVFRVWGKVYGYSVGRLYYPSYFDGLRAVHGWPDVPPYPASHGCVRVPNWTAVWLHGLMPVGTEVRVYSP